MNPEVLLAGSIGALGVFVLTVLKTVLEDWFQGWRRRKRELKGLLRLVSVEIALHRTLVLDDYLQADSANNTRREKDPGLFLVVLSTTVGAKKG